MQEEVYGGNSSINWLENCGTLPALNNIKPDADRGDDTRDEDEGPNADNYGPLADAVYPLLSNVSGIARYAVD